MNLKCHYYIVKIIHLMLGMILFSYDSFYQLADLYIYYIYFWNVALCINVNYCFYVN
jgi:hypothetical protein